MELGAAAGPITSMKPIDVADGGGTVGYNMLVGDGKAKITCNKCHCIRVVVRGGRKRTVRGGRK